MDVVWKGTNAAEGRSTESLDDGRALRAMVRKSCGSEAYKRNEETERGFSMAMMSQNADSAYFADW